MPTKKRKEYKASTILNPFFYQVEVIFTNDWVGTIDKFELEGSFNNAAGVCIPLDGSCILVFDSTVVTHGIIAHESVHCVFAVLESVGQDPSKGEETFCYMVQHVIMFCNEIAKKHKILIHSA